LTGTALMKESTSNAQTAFSPKVLAANLITAIFEDVDMS